eukprot:COSAG01_NODE_4979_length_4565_cov_5.005364_4_plen_121_part_00
MAAMLALNSCWFTYAARARHAGVMGTMPDLLLRRAGASQLTPAAATAATPPAGGAEKPEVRFLRFGLLLRLELELELELLLERLRLLRSRLLAAAHHATFNDATRAHVRLARPPSVRPRP